MCGRTACTLAPDELCKACHKKSFDVSWRDHPGHQHNYSPSYNVAPTMHTPVIFSGHHLKTMSNEEPATKYIMQPMMWSLIPHFYKGDNAKSHGYTTNNCRVEGVKDKPMFSHLLNKGQRCVVLCDGFYEWQAAFGGGGSKTKTPHLIYAPQPEHVRIWDRTSWENKADEPSTTEAERVQKISSYPEKVHNASTDTESLETKVLKTSIESGKVQKTSTDCDEFQEPGKETEKAEGAKEVADTTAKQKGLLGTSQTADDWRGPEPLKMAGLFSKWISTEKEEVWSYTVLTTESGPGFDWLHHRVPVILSTQEQVESWLDSNTPLRSVLKSVGEPSIKWHPVTSQVNNSRNNTVACMQPAGQEKPRGPACPSSRLMASWLGKRTAPDHDSPHQKKRKVAG